MWLHIGFGFVVALSVYCWLGIKRAYEKGRTLPLSVSMAIWFSDIAHFLLVLWSSLQSLWLIPLNKTVAVICGLTVSVIGFIIMLAGIIEFRSFRKISGLEISSLIRTGIYRYCRNPQYVGWFLVLTGISIAGRSGIALLLTIALIIGIHFYNVKLEEPYLEHVFGEEYRQYKSSVPRYFRFLKRRKASITSKTELED
jgi:protein-S-isoprenylcysteine O-methyltransferase Ste14